MHVKKQELRKQLEIYQVDEDFEEEQYTVTGQTADDVMLPNIRETNRHRKDQAVKKQLQLPRKLSPIEKSAHMTGFQPHFETVHATP